MFRKMLEDDRRRAGGLVGRVAQELGVSIRDDPGIEAGERWPYWETFHRICELFGWPQTSAGNVGRSIAGD